MQELLLYEIICDIIGSGQYIFANIQRAVLPRFNAPFDKRDRPARYFDSRDTSRMHSAAVIKILRFPRRWQHRPVCMPRDQHHIFAADPVQQPALRRFFSAIVLRGARRVIHTKRFQRPPQIAHQKTRQAPIPAVERVGLMTVDQQYLMPCVSSTTAS